MSDGRHSCRQLLDQVVQNETWFSDNVFWVSYYNKHSDYSAGPQVTYRCDLAWMNEWIRQSRRIYIEHKFFQ